ncbi:hypothetical protein CH238_11275 [[Clostridium] leptum DSM 753]|uniref:Uncharacterized protein n=1 Tax=[Clostridium] leptum DSM 753 TaxID=428125 RepID=A0A855A2C1_9FIRM|nr:hypothetical protein CH238_11275 [[Clostridium] leptum DSM 753]RGU02452.1 hypothetical protein DWW99_09030 [[Clostridium] leptum]
MKICFPPSACSYNQPFPAWAYRLGTLYIFTFRVFSGTLLKDFPTIRFQFIPQRLYRRSAPAVKRAI